MSEDQIEVVSSRGGACIPAIWSLEPKQTLGLALSGGGFRASLFHIGVLARLAELDLLRSVSVLSTVSGGSIVGAYYYLKVKELLEGRRKGSDGQAVAPSSQAYVDIVSEIEREFLACVQTNVRMRALVDPVANAKMIFSDDYSRSDRIAEVYDECFYRRFSSDPARKITLPDLLITPVGMQPGFDVRAYNDAATYKIPILNINATSLNTGGRWVFTAVQLGEVASPDSIDTIQPLRLIQYSDTTLTQKQQDKLKEIGLAEAVAASACVPAVFTPLAIHDLYPPGPNGEDYVVELVDGGVYDNQGVEALLSENCDYMICSDACGQLDENRTPGTQLLPVATRANDILMTRVRAECFDSLRTRPGGGKFVFFHLRDAFSGNSGYPPLPGPVDQCNGKDDGLVYALSNIRTDLDSFSDMEAYTLMYDGYCLSDYFLQRAENNCGLGTGAPGGTPREPWRFLAIRQIVETDKTLLLSRLLDGKYLFFKSFYADPVRAGVYSFMIVAPVLLLLWRYFDWVEAAYRFLVKDFLYSVLPFALIGAALYAIVMGMDDKPAALKFFDFIRKYRRGDNKFLVGVFYIPGLLGAAAAFVHLKIFNKIFLQAGRLPGSSDGGPASRSNGSN
ncbi:patatin-like phospholipase family protein [Methylocystis parvus]|uniref:Patatin family protein n=1 Tax=Methylocystis parvus TaxID=134 RepID=A0A6B8M9R2_9HYPH|nr:patatin-like phospholipase family protein [Methylocystis parvus]QGM99348.1 patatin family protein [Methylocystis parvus]WBK00261.1 hypothetical protein MMG94_00615 [Methylocystis parvus OBBP]